jgi:hypothetical protein
MNLETPSAPVTLEGIEVRGDQRCVVRPEEGLALTQLWEEARKALRVQAWTEEEGLYEYQISNYERELGPGARVIQSETRETNTRVARIPFRSASAEDLLTHGFIRALEDGYFEFYAPDAGVLLSDPFLDTHCFRLTEDSRIQGSIGLAFEPIRGRSLPEIEGTLWLERESARLQFLEYRYANVPYQGATDAAGGRVEFEGLPSGAWIVNRWWILMPRVTRFRLPRRLAVSHYRVASFTEAGGEVLQVYSADELILREVPQGVLAGVVWDSIQAQPLAGAEVSLTGTPYRSVTDSIGRFAMMELPEGVYRTGISHPVLDSLGLAFPGIEVEIAQDGVTDIEMAIPSIETLLASVCESTEEEPNTFALVGTVRLRGSGEPIPKATVTIEWIRPRGPVVRDVGFDRMTTGMEGRYVFCGLPHGMDIRVSASFTDHMGDTTTVRAENDRTHLAMNLELDLPPGMLTFRTSSEGIGRLGREQGIQGRVVDPVTGRPVPDAEVTIRWTQGDFTTTETTNSQGFFRVLSPWLGTFTLQAQALGYKDFRADSLEVEPNRLTVVEIELPQEPIPLEPLVVVAQARTFLLEMNGFYDRADQGFGHFVTPEQIEARHPVEVSDLLRDIPGLVLERTVFGTRVRFRKPDLHDDACDPRLYVDGILISQPSPFNSQELGGTYLGQVVPLTDIEGLEVHTRLAGIPPAYGGSQGSCGIILIWTKGGE